MIAPLIIVISFVSYYLLLVLMMLALHLPAILNVGIIIFSGIVSSILIWVLIDRIKEIRGGEEDDLGKY
jgi:hypothetical protein